MVNDMYEKLNFKTGQVLSASDLNHMEDGIEAASKAGGITEVSWGELRTLRDNNQLKAGASYRITDFVTTSAQENTRSAGHQFDIIVTADNENTLNEVARACLHEGDTYFSEAGANLAAWKIWYSLENDTERFAWADTQNGKGVIYRMIDEWSNDLPYDFKNIQFKRNLNFEEGNAQFSENGEETWVYTFAGQSYHIDNDEYSEMLDGSLESPFGHMSDESTSTFHDNVIKPYMLVYDVEDEMREKCGITYLNNIVFLGYWEKIGSTNDENMPYYYAACCHYNSFGSNCYNNTFGNSCHDNTFGLYCHTNTFSPECTHNTFGNRCSYNVFNVGCVRNTFGNSCSNNYLGKSCALIRFQFNSLIAGDGFDKNTFGNEVTRVSLQNSSTQNIVNPVQYYKIADGTGDSGNETIVEVERNNSYETHIGKNSDGELKVFCLADLA